MRKAKIICTIGPSSNDAKTLKQMIDSGMDIARLNFSHGSHKEHLKTINLIRKLSSKVRIMMDTMGPVIRIGIVEKGKVSLKAGQKFTLTTKNIIGNKDICSITYSGLPKDLRVGNRLLIDDGLIEMIVEHVDDDEIICTVKNSGILKDRKKINTPGIRINLPSITEKDTEDMEFGIENRVDYISVSFVRSAKDISEVRKIMEKHNEKNIKIISKIETEEGVHSIDKIIDASDGVMIARGDLGVEIAPEEVPIVQKMIIKKCNYRDKPVITATQMLHSMTENPRPTRAEVNDVANAILDGSDMVMLSAETSSGKYPLESLKTMSRIIERIETSIYSSKI